MADNEGYTPQTAPLGTADDLAIAHEHGRPAAAKKSAKSTKVAPLTTADVAPKKAKGAKKSAKKKGK